MLSVNENRKIDEHYREAFVRASAHRDQPDRSIVITGIGRS